MSRNAIIMAAGMSSRFVPLSLETPKALLKVKGEIMIERQIRQLREAGINEIIIVVGYLKEQFAYLEEKYDEIVEFSELGKFIDVPIKNYSSGMKSKLGFSIATIANPDILILDEVLSVGDAKFRKKSEAKIMQLMEGGTTVLFVSHSLAQVRRICDRAMILDHGTLKAIGGIDEISNQYEAMIEATDTGKKKK